MQFERDSFFAQFRLNFGRLSRNGSCVFHRRAYAMENLRG